MRTMSKEWNVMLHAYRVAYRAAWLMEELDSCFKEYSYYNDVDVPETVKTAYLTQDDWIRAQVRGTAAELERMIKEMGE